MATINFTLSDEDVDRIADRVTARLETVVKTLESPALPKKESRAVLLVGRNEAARLLGCSTATLDRLLERRLLNPNRATRRIMLSVKELERFVEETKVQV